VVGMWSGGEGGSSAGWERGKGDIGKKFRSERIEVLALQEREALLKVSGNRVKAQFLIE